MSRKAWVFTTQDGNPVDAISARKKIAYVEEYLCDLFAQHFGGDYADLKKHVTRTSGQELILEKDGETLQATLGSVDDKTWTRFEKSSDADW